MHEFFLRRVAPEFFGGRFDGPGDELRFIGGLLTAESLVRFKAGIDRLASEFEELARSDARRPLAERDSCSAILGAASVGVLGVRRSCGAGASRRSAFPGWTLRAGAVILGTMSAAIQSPRPTHPDEDAFGLPGWIYHDPRFLRAGEALDLPHQLAAGLPQQRHSRSRRLSPLRPARRIGRHGARQGWPAAQLPQRLPSSRFAPARRHRRATAVTASPARITHWSYSLEGKLIGVPQRASFRDLDMASRGLVALEQEIFMGFVFVRFEPGLPSVREMVAPYADELAAYRMEELVPQGRVTLRPRQVNWKNVADNYSDGMHIPVAHPGLTRLFGRSYAHRGAGLDRQDVGRPAGRRSSSNWSERLYQRLLPQVDAPAGGAAAAVDLFQAVAERGVRHLSRPDRLHAVHPGVADRDPDPRDRLRASRQPPRNARRALPELAHQPAGQRRRQDADRARAGRHGVEQLYGRAAERERGLPAQLRAAHATHDPGVPGKSRSDSFPSDSIFSEGRAGQRVS